MGPTERGLEGVREKCDRTGNLGNGGKRRKMRVETKVARKVCICVYDVYVCI